MLTTIAMGILMIASEAPTEANPSPRAALPIDDARLVATFLPCRQTEDQTVALIQHEVDGFLAMLMSYERMDPASLSQLFHCAAQLMPLPPRCAAPDDALALVRQRNQVFADLLPSSAQSGQATRFNSAYAWSGAGLDCSMWNGVLW